MKLDCEGAEYEILFGCSDENLKKILKISMECHNIDTNRNADQLKKFLEKQGFKVTIKSDKHANAMLYAVR